MMIELASFAGPGDADVEFDEYVPVTVTWPESLQLLETPLYVRCVEDHRLLELKFSPLTKNLVELVLVNSPGLRRTDAALAAEISDINVNARWAGDDKGGSFDRLEVTAFEDCLMMNFSGEPIDAWTGTGPVFFGTVTSGSVGAICVRWTPSDQEVVFG
jgi:hypothetical protein